MNYKLVSVVILNVHLSIQHVAARCAENKHEKVRMNNNQSHAENAKKLLIANEIRYMSDIQQLKKKQQQRNQQL